MVETNLLQVETDLKALALVLSWFEQLREHFIPDIVWIQCQTALAEGFTNTVRHAHKERSPDTPIQIEVKILAQSLEIRIWDYGPIFDLQKKLSTLSQEVNQYATGGRGLYLISQIADTFSYTRTLDDRNCLLIVKHWHSQT